MSDFPFTLEQMVLWIRSKEHLLAERGITLAEIKTSDIHIPSLAADFDAPLTTGRIDAWVTGQIDFTVLSREDATLQHSKHDNFANRRPDESYEEFLRNMSTPNSSPT